MKKIVSVFGDHSEPFRVLNRRSEEYARKLGFQYEWKVMEPFSREAVIACLKQADVGIIDTESYGEEIFREICCRNRLLVRFGVGYDNVDLEAASRYGITVARTTGANTLAVAEMALTLMLSLRRRLAQNSRLVEQGGWGRIVVRETVGSVIGIMGFGAIGQTLAKLLSGMGCQILAYDPFPNEKALKEYGVTLVSLEELFARSDVVTIHIPMMPATYHIVGTELIASMKETAVLINTSRGGIVDEQALYLALREKKIAGAALDVFEQEPLPSDSPLRELDNLLMTPHASSQTAESLWRINQMAIDIAAAFFAGKEDPRILNPEVKQSVGREVAS